MIHLSLRQSKAKQSKENKIKMALKSESSEHDI